MPNEVPRTSCIRLGDAWRKPLVTWHPIRKMKLIQLLKLLKLGDIL